MNSSARKLIAAACIAAAMMIAGCESNSGKDHTPEAATVRRDAPPAYTSTAKAFNEKVKHLDRVFARANLKLTYFDEKNERKTEDPEGRLQIVRPDKLALSLGKAGQTLFWFGCDPDRYWWLDMSDNAKMFAAVGRHENFDAGAAERIGIAIRPLDLIALMGIVPLREDGRGATQWSADGTQLGVTTPIGGGGSGGSGRGYQRLWLDPESLDVIEVEIFDTKRQLLVNAKHEGSEPVEMTRELPGVKVSRIRVPQRVFITHLPSETEVRITLSGVKDGPVSEKAFDLNELMTRFGVERIVDLDKRRSR